MDTKPKEDAYGRMTWLWLLAGAYILLRLTEGFFQSFCADEFLHMHDAWMVSQGHLPYRDFFEHHACWYYYMMGPLVRIFSPETNVNAAVGFLFFARAVSFIIGTLALGVLFCAGRDWIGKEAGILSVILISGVPFFLETSVQTRPDVPALALWVGCLSLLVKELDRKREERPEGSMRMPFPQEAFNARRFFAAGLCLGAGIMFTQKLLFVGLGLALALSSWIWLCRAAKASHRLAMIMCFAGGVGIPVGCTWFIFATQGAGGVFVSKVFLINAHWAYFQSPVNMLLSFLIESGEFIVLVAAGAVWVWVGMIRQRRIDWTGIVCQCVLAGWFVGLYWIVPVADPQFFLIPLPVAALLAARALSDFAALVPRKIAPVFLVGLAMMTTIPSISVVWERIQDRRLAAQALESALWVIQNTKPGDSVADGWTGIGVFRPQAWYYGFVHCEIPPMIPKEEKQLLMRDLETGRIRPMIIANDGNLFELHERLRSWVKVNYVYRSKPNLYIRSEYIKEVNPDGNQ